jgi:hypothetical protein
VTAEWAFVLGVVVGTVIAWAWVLVGPVHIHRWTKYRPVRIFDAADRTYVIDGQVRNCRVCDREQVLR